MYQVCHDPSREWYVSGDPSCYVFYVVLLHVMYLVIFHVMYAMIPFVMY